MPIFYVNRLTYTWKLKLNNKYAFLIKIILFRPSTQWPFGSSWCIGLVIFATKKVFLKNSREKPTKQITWIVLLMDRLSNCSVPNYSYIKKCVKLKVRRNKRKRQNYNLEIHSESFFFFFYNVCRLLFSIPYN